MVSGDSFVGETGIRYQLNDWLMQIGGHVGYGIRPRFQRQGYGKLILKLALDKLRESGVERALVTCYDHNIASGKSDRGEWRRPRQYHRRPPGGREIKALLD